MKMSHDRIVKNKTEHCISSRTEEIDRKVNKSYISICKNLDTQLKLLDHIIYQNDQDFIETSRTQIDVKNMSISVKHILDIVKTLEKKQKEHHEIYMFIFIMQIVLLISILYFG